MQRADADETLDQLHEILDERFEAGPAPYIINRMTAEPLGADEWAVEVVYRPDATADVRTLRHEQLTVDGAARTPLELAWDIYRALEGGAAAS